MGRVPLGRARDRARARGDERGRARAASRSRCARSATEGDAERERFCGSPTIRVDGRDVQDPGDEPIGLTCRVYRLRDGRISALPDPRGHRRGARGGRRETHGPMTESEPPSARQAPELALPDTDGELRSLPSGPAEAAATVVFWTCNHCPYALAWHGRLVDVATDYADRGVRFLAVNSNDSERYPADSARTRCASASSASAGRFPYLLGRDPGGGAGLGRADDPAPVRARPGAADRLRGRPGRRPPGSVAAGRVAARRRSTPCSRASSRRPSTEPVGCSIKWR